MGPHTSGLKSGVLYFTMEENDVPYHLTKALYSPLSADCIKLVRDGVTYDIADPAQACIQKTTKSNYKLTLSKLAFGELGTLQDGDILIVEGKFTGGNTNTDVVVDFTITTTFISVADGAVTFSQVDPRS
jgi:hypothetical protein